MKKLATPQFWFIYDCLHPKVGVLFAGGQSQAKNWSYFFVVVAVLGPRKVWKSERTSRNHLRYFEGKDFASIYKLVNYIPSSPLVTSLLSNCNWICPIQIKVRQSRNDFFQTDVSSKNEWTNSTLLLWNLRSTCFRSFFGRNIGWKKSFRLCLTFNTQKDNRNSTSRQRSDVTKMQ